MPGYTLGAVPSPYDSRDYQVARFAPATTRELPARWSFRDLLPPITDQGRENTCVGHAGVGVMGYQQIVSAPAGQAPDREVLSARDLYEGARSIDRPWGDGAYPRAALKYAQKTGVCRADLWPYLDGQPGAAVTGADASRYANRILTYSRVPLAASALKDAMYWHGPLLVVIMANEGFLMAGKNGHFSWRGAELGNHAVVLSGWDDDRGLLLRNSWGTAWGDQGYGWLPYDWTPSEAWVCTPALDAPPPEIPWWERLFPWLFLG